MHNAAVLLLVLSAPWVQAEADDFVITGRNDAEGAPTRSRRKDAPRVLGKELPDVLEKELTERDYDRQAGEILKLLAQDTLKQEDRDELSEAINRDATRAAKAFANYLNWKKAPDPRLRLAALEALGVAYTGTGVGKHLGASALTDPDDKMRAAAIQLIKDRKDREAVKYVFQALLNAMENGEAVNVVNEGQYKAAVKTLSEIGCKQVYQALLYYDRLAMMVGITGPDSLEHIKLMAPSVDLPISVANESVGLMQYVKTLPGLPALKAISGEDFGHDHKKWQKWIDAQPAYKP